MGLLQYIEHYIASLLQQWLLNKDQRASVIVRLQISQILLELHPLQFDCDAINSSLLISSPLLLQSAFLDHASLTISFFRAPGIGLELHGLHVITKPRSINDDFWSSKEKLKRDEHKRKAIFALDPPGAAVHKTAEMLSRQGQSRSILGVFIGHTVLKAIRVEMHDISLKVDSNMVNGFGYQYSFYTDCWTVDQVFPEGSRGTIGFGAAMAIVLVDLLRSADVTVCKKCMIQGFRFYLRRVHFAAGKQDNLEGKACNRETLGKSLLVSKEILMVLKYQNTRLSELNADILETTATVNPLEVQALLLVVSQFQGLPRKASSATDESNSEGSVQPSSKGGQHLWHKVVERVRGGSWKRFRNAVETQMLRQKYMQVYSHWLHETGVVCTKDYKKRSLSQKQQWVLEGIQKDLYLMEQGLPVEAVTFARCLARKMLHDEESHGTALASISARRYNSVFHHLNPVCGALKKVWCYLLFLFYSMFRLIGRFIKQVMIIGYDWVKCKYVKHALDLMRRLPIVERWFAGHLEGNSARESNSNYTGCFNKRMCTMRYAVSFHKGSFIISGSSENQAGESFKNIMATAGKVVGAAVSLMWDNIGLAYLSTTEVLHLELTCGYIQGEVMHSQKYHETVDTQKVGQSFDSNRGNVVKIFSTSPAPDADDKVEYEKPLVSFTSQGSKHRVEDLEVDGQRPFLFLALEDFQAGLTSNLGTVKCILAMGLIDCTLDRLSLLHLVFLFKQCQLILWDAGTSTEVIAVTPRDYSIREIGAKYFSGMKQLMSFVSITRKLSLSAAIQCPRFHFYGFFSDLEEDLEGIPPNNHEKAVLIICLGLLEATIQPAEVQQINDKFAESSQGHWYNMIETRTWLRKPLVPSVGFSNFVNYIDHQQIGNNLTLSIQGLSVLFQSDGSKLKNSPLMGPVNLRWELSTCRDHFVSPHGLTNVVSAASGFSVSVIPLNIELTKLDALLKATRSIWRLSRQLPLFRSMSDESLTTGSVGADWQVLRGATSTYRLSSSNVQSTAALVLYFAVSAEIKFDGIICTICYSPKSKTDNAPKSTTYLKPLSEVKKRHSLEQTLDNHIDTHENEVYILCNGLTFQFSWGDGLPLSVFSELSKASIRVVNPVNEIIKNSQVSYTPWTFKIKDRVSEPASVLQMDKTVSEVFVERLSLTLKWDSYEIVTKMDDCSPQEHAESVKQNRQGWTVTNLEIAKLHLTDGTLDELMVKTLSRVKPIDVLSIDINMTRNLKSLYVIAREGLIVVDAHALIKLKEETQKLFLSLKHIFIGNGSIGEVLTSSADNIWHESIHNLHRSASIPIQHALLPVPKQGRLNSAPNRSSIVEKESILRVFPWLMEGLSLEFRGPCLVLALTDGSSEPACLVLEFDASAKLEGGIKGRAIDCKVTQLSMYCLELSGKHLGRLEHSTQNHAPKSGSSLSLVSDSHTDKIPNDLQNPSNSLKGTSLSGDLKSNKQTALDGWDHDLTSFSNLEGVSSEKIDYIIEKLKFSCTLENVVMPSFPSVSLNGWEGSCSLSGSDIAVTTSEIQLLSALFASFSGLSTSQSKSTLNTNTEQSLLSGETAHCAFDVPDGSIVAVKDVHEHLYMAVEKTDNQYRLIGVLHYSLVGDKALFKVKYQKHRSSMPPSWFSLISVGAKDANGEHFRVHFRPGSGLADVSSVNNGSGELWQMLPCKNSTKDDDESIQFHSGLHRNLVYLVNQKSKQGLTLAGGAPMMVPKPGSPMKIKVLESTGLEENHCLQTPKQMPEIDVPGRGKDFSMASFAIPKVDVKVGSITLTLLHGMGQGKHLLPLLRGRLEDVGAVVHVHPCKSRLMGECKIVFEYLEANSDQWSLIVQPVETEIFYRLRTTAKSQYTDQGVKLPASLFARFKRVDCLISETSLDALFFVLGVLNISGPYTMKHSPVMASSCMVENHTGVELGCSFDNKIHRGVGSIAAWSKDAFLIRNLNSRRDTWPEKAASSLSVFLEKRGVALSSPIHVSLSEPSIAAVQTRLEKKQGSKNASGPLIVVEVSRQSQDGITVTVSPVVRIHNSSGLPLELRFQRPNDQGEGAIVVLEHGDVIDDSMGAFDAINLEGVLKKALSSFNLGNYLLSVRPKLPSGTSPEDLSKTPVFEWSEDIKGAKANHASGFFESLQYGLRKSLKARNIATSFGSVHCGLSGRESIEKPHGVHLCIRSVHRQVPVIPISTQDKLGPTQTVVAWQEQQELVVFPTVHVYNFLDSNISMSLEGKGDAMLKKEVFIEQGDKKSLYVDLTELDFTVRIENHQITSKAVSLGDWRRTFEQLTAHTPDDSLKELEVGLDFGNNRKSVKLKAFRGDDGVLQVIVYTLYMLKNRSEKTFVCCGAKQTKPFWVITPPWNKEHKVLWPAGESGTAIQPGSKISWIERSDLVLFQMPEKGAVPTLFDLESFSGSAELSLWICHESGEAEQFKIGLTMNLTSAEDSDPTRVITIDSRYIVVNDSDETIFVCQDGYQDDEAARVLLNPGKHFALTTRSSPRVKSINHGQSHHVGGDIVDASHTFVRFRLKENGWDWSGPICASALGSFSLRVCRSSDALDQLQGNIALENQVKFKFIAIHVEEDSPSLIVRFCTQSTEGVPYRIENALVHASMIYYQKGLGDMPMTLEPGGLIGYAWDDLSLPHALVVQIAGTEFCNEINLDQLRPWRSFHGAKPSNVLGLLLPFQNQEEASENYYSKGGELSGSLDSINVGYEVCADGPHRVLRVCEKYKVSRRNNWQSHVSMPSLKMDFKVPIFAITLFEFARQRNDGAIEEARVLDSRFSAIISLKMSSFLVEILRTEKHSLLQLKVQSLSVDEKWQGAPFASMLRVHNQDRFRKGETVLHMAAIVSNHASNPNHVKYSSILLQAIDVNLDEETLLKLVPFYRQSLAESTSSRQIYFERFEIHPIKIVATFLPGQLHADYSSTQEAFRTLLHSFIKLPSIRGRTVELNGVLLSHALLTFRQLVIKCAQHYSWYAMRAIYIARGSKLLPPAFASLFDDSAAASIDVFFDPSNGSIDLQGLTLGMFNLLSDALHKRGFSGTSRYIGDLERTMKTAGSNIIFAILTEVSDNVLKGAETGGLNGMVNGFRRGILNVSMEPSVLRSTVVKGGSSRRIKLDCIVGVDESYIEGYIQAMLDTLYKQDYLWVKVIDDQVLLKNLPPNSMLIEEIMGSVKSFLVREGLLAGETSVSAMQSIRRLQGENEKRLGPAVVSLCEQLFVIFAVRALRNQARSWFFPGHDKKTEEKTSAKQNDTENRLTSSAETEGVLPRQRGIKGILASFVLSSVMAYIDGRLCRHIPNTLARRVVSGFLLSFVE